MLISLSIQNLALVENLLINFQNGLTVLTGETGAGKSLLVDAISIIVGSRKDVNMIRRGCDRLIIEAVIDSFSEEWNQFFKVHNFPLNKVTTLRREITNVGKSQSWLNGVKCTLADLRAASRIWMRLNSQYAYHSLLDPNQHLSILDDVLGINQKLDLEVAKLVNANSQLNKMKFVESNNREHLNWLELQLSDLIKLSPKHNEWSDLCSERDSLRHVTQLKQYLMDSIKDLDEAHKYLDSACRFLNRASIILSSIENDTYRLKSNLIELEDILSLVKDKCNYWCNKEDGFIEVLESRMAKFEKLARRYNCQPDELINKITEFQKEYDDLVKINNNTKELTSFLSKTSKEYYEMANTLHKRRLLLLPKLETEVNEQLRLLGITGANLQIKLAISEDLKSIPGMFGYPVKLSNKGFSNVSFLIESNIGEGLRPFNKVISGGELSRFSLALQRSSIAVSDRNIDPLVLVLDEVDAGIGGIAAIAVGNVIVELSKYHQVLAITHLAQIAAKAKHHGVLHKKTKNGRTYSSFSWLSKEDRVYEIARLLSGHPEDNLAIKHANSLLC